jgi:hypothetical protein
VVNIKKIFEIIGVFSLFIFSYIYTSKVASLFLETDDLMVSIIDYKEKNDSNCKEGYITDEGIILGISGLIVDKNKSYSNMKGSKFDENLVIYSKDKCKINKENNLDKYILKGNNSKRSISLLININNYDEELINFINSKDIDVSLVLDNFIDINDNLKNKIKKYSLLYSGVNENELKLLKEFNKNIFCITINKDNLNMCMKNKINTIKTLKIFNKNLYNSVKSNVENGDIILLTGSKEIIKDFDVIVNFINAKGLKIVSIFELLE